jgi:glycosyltransferase involved in cell wall biosynthesis
LTIDGAAHYVKLTPRRVSATASSASDANYEGRLHLGARDEAAAWCILQVLPRHMRYTQSAATSIDLYVSEMAAHSRFRVEVTAESSDRPLPAAAFHALPRFAFAETQRRSRRVAALVDALRPAAVVVQQHLPSAAALRARVDAPIILQKHNFLRVSRNVGWLRDASHWRRARQLNALAGITFVSRAILGEFERDWPEVTIPRRVIANGFDTAAWRPRPARERTVLAVGRATPEKGLLEAARALAAILPRHPDWTATFVVSEPDGFPDYFAAIGAALAPLGPQARLLVGLPFDQVKELDERAAIALAPSVWREPFGRTCLEAHAGGAAVVSSGSGGLREISGEAALYLPAVEPGRIAEAVEALIVQQPLRERLAAEGRARVERLFDVRCVAAELDDFCAEAIERARHPRGATAA